MPQSIRLRLRVGATFAAAATAAAMLPLVAAGTASAAGTCAAPTALSPDDGPTSISPDRKEVVLKWTGVPGAASYQVQISPDEDFTSNVAIDATTVATTYVPTILLGHGSYFWRVRVSNATCWSDDNGRAAEFSRSWAPAPVAQVPANGSSVQASEVKFAWGRVRDAAEYLLEVVGPDDFTAACFVDNNTYTPYVLGSDPGLAPERFGPNSDCGGFGAALEAGDYAWNVSPVDSTGVKANDTPYSQFAYSTAATPNAPANSTPPAGIAVNSAELGLPVAGGTFTVVEDSTDLGATLGTPTATALDGNLNAVDCSNVCGTTPTLTWTPAVGATAYRVTIATDKYFTHTIREYDTAFATFTPRDLMLDAQAGQAYYYVVTSDNGLVSPVETFRIRTAPVVGLVSALAGNDVTLSWSDPVDNKDLTEAEQYDVQVSTDCSFSTPVDEGTTDLPQFTSTTKRYAPGTYYWRVKSILDSGASGPWSVGNKDVPQCADNAASFVIPSAGNNVPTPGSAVSGPVKVDATAKAIVRTGPWAVAHTSMAYLKNVLVTNGNTHQKLAFTFNNGTSARVSYCSGPLNGYFTVYVDGQAKKTLNAYKRFVKCGLSYTVTGLDKTKNHTISIVATAKRGHTPKGGKHLSIDYFQVA